MIERHRQSYNASFDSDRYRSMLAAIENTYPGELDFRVAETPAFIDQRFTQQMIDTGSYIIDKILEPDFIARTEQAIPDQWRIPGPEGRPTFLAFDFGVCSNEEGHLQPQLIELQGFPSLFGYQSKLAEWYRLIHPIEDSLSPYLSGLNQPRYLEMLRNCIIGQHDPENVILLEILPAQQKTRIDFAITQDLLKIPIVCLTDIRLHDGKLHYLRDGQLKPVRRIYNRIIFDELEQQPESIRKQGELLMKDSTVEWCPHPNWFYRVSKFLLPYLHHPCVPTTYFLNEVKQIPPDLSQYVLKPLFSFAGQGVIIDPTPEDLQQIQDPSNWILQRKVNYAPVIPTPDDPAKLEIRLFYFWPEDAPKPIPTLNLARLSKGKMVGTRYNKDRMWVGGSICFFEQ
jgi:hypothetical protein